MKKFLLAATATLGITSAQATTIPVGDYVQVFTNVEFNYDLQVIRRDPGTSLPTFGTGAFAPFLGAYLNPTFGDGFGVNIPVLSIGAIAPEMAFSLNGLSVSAVLTSPWQVLNNNPGELRMQALCTISLTGFEDTGGYCGITTTPDATVSTGWRALDGWASAGNPLHVPGPIVGAGLPGLVAACGGLFLARRRRQKIA